jgi:hypothetical protein
LKKVYTGKADLNNLSEKETFILDQLVDFGLLDIGYDITPEGERAAQLLDKYSKQEREDLRVARQLAAAETDSDMDYPRDERGRENFAFTEMEQHVLNAAGMDAAEIAKIFIQEKEDDESCECTCVSKEDEDEDKDEDVELCDVCKEKKKVSENYGGHDDYWGEDDYEDYNNRGGRSMFADPGGKSALRAATRDNPRNLPCPTCEEPNRLTPEDVRLGYQCDDCADAAESGMY